MTARLPMPKIVWLLWLQGWDVVPWLVREVASSWERFNPGWTVVLLDRNNIGEHCSIVSHPPPFELNHQAYSDVARLTLLAERGGVWADATMLCMQRLDDWVPEAMQPEGFWMYRGGQNRPCTDPASWFMISEPASPIATQWLDSCRQYHSINRASHLPYCWMDQLFLVEMHQCDRPQLAQSWANVPSLSCEDSGQSHMLAGRTELVDPHLQAILWNDPPRAVKLNHKAFPHDYVDAMEACNAVVAIRAAQMHAEKRATA